jgi:hypothetical protein
MTVREVAVPLALLIAAIVLFATLKLLHRPTHWMDVLLAVTVAGYLRAPRSRAVAGMIQAAALVSVTLVGMITVLALGPAR